MALLVLMDVGRGLRLVFKAKCRINGSNGETSLPDLCVFDLAQDTVFEIVAGLQFSRIGCAGVFFATSPARPWPSQTEAGASHLALWSWARRLSQ